MKHLRIAGILAVLLAVLGGLAYWDERKTISENAEKETKNKIYALDPETVTEMRFFASSSVDENDKNKVIPGTEVSLNKKDGIWYLTSPISGVADDSTVKGILTAVKDYKYEKEVASAKSEWKNFGLDPAQRKVTLKISKDGKDDTFTLYVGNKAPVGYSVYAATDKGEQVYIGSQYLLTSTAKSLQDFRDKTVVKVEEKDIKTISYTSRGRPTIEIEKIEGKYKITKPQQLTADDAFVRDLVNSLAGLKASEFVDSPSAKQKKAFEDKSQNARISWTLGSGSKDTLQFASIDGATWAAFDPNKLMMKLPDDFKDKLNKSVIDFQDKKIFSFAAKDVNEVTVDGVVYKKDKDQWKTEGKSEPATHIASLLVDLEFAKTEEFMDLKNKDVVKALEKASVHRIILGMTPESKAEAVTIEAWPNPHDATKYYLRRTGGTMMYKVADTLLDNIEPKPVPDAGDTATKSQFNPDEPVAN